MPLLLADVAGASAAVAATSARTAKAAALATVLRQAAPNEISPVVAWLSGELTQRQTDALLARQTHQEGITVHVRPELVVEIAIDGVQTSTRYPAGAALSFARVRRYREDKTPADADELSSVLALRDGTA